MFKIRLSIFSQAKKLGRWKVSILAICPTRNRSKKSNGQEISSFLLDWAQWWAPPHHGIAEYKRPTVVFIKISSSNKKGQCVSRPVQESARSM